MNIDKINLTNPIEKKEVEDFLSSFELQYDKGVDFTVVARENNKIIATVSKQKNIIKCFAIDDSHQGEGISTKILTSVINQMFDEGYFHNLVFTKTKNKSLFQGMGYKEVAHTDKVILMEMGNKSIDKTINKIITKYDIDTSSKRAMIVMNCNPFTFGHQYLIEKAASENNEVLIFIVEEDKSSFPFKDRIELVKQGTSHIKNVKVIPGTEYLISSATFPNYFLRQEDDFLIEYTKLDAAICGSQFGKKLNINRRYVGDEPYCKVTNRYNESLKEILPTYGVEVVVVPRKELNGKAISASTVREYIKEDKIQELKDLVPQTTYDFLTSPKGKEIGEKIKANNSPH